jgi:hypothetical protein
MTRLETLRNELYNAVTDKNAKMADFRDLCAELFNEMGGESKLRELKKEALKARARGLGALEELDELMELEKQIDELERYKLWK